MNATPRVSTLITSYNSARYIAETMRSVVNQTYRDMEIVIVDDGSSDNSEEVIRSVALHLTVESTYAEHKSGPILSTITV